MSSLLIGIDAGNYNAKVAGPYGEDIFRTKICGWFVRNVDEEHGHDDMEFEIGDRKGYAGTIAVNEDQFDGIAMYGESKVHEDTKIRVLLAIHRYIVKYAPDTTHISIVVGQPIKTHLPGEKEELEKMLRGPHDFIVNGKKRKFTIVAVGVAPEGSGAYWANPQDGRVRIIDIGSGTVNCATILDNRHINTASETFNFGMETVKNKSDLKEVARLVISATSTLKWRKTDKVFVCGGVANELLPHLTHHFSDVQTLVPHLQMKSDAYETLAPDYANAVGFYELARLNFG